MSGLGHFLENEGIPTVSISLVREHSQAMAPPRALWVPFALGRPFGTPHDPKFQKRVLMAALELLSAEQGPILADFREDAPAPKIEDTSAWVCPVSFKRPQDTGQPDSSLTREIETEIQQLRPWYELAIERRGRTTVGLAGWNLEQSARFLASMASEGDGARTADESTSLVNALRWSSDDLKAYYLEAVTAQPGHASQAELETWFWRETAAGRMIRALREVCLRSSDDGIRDVGDFMLVPEAYIS